MVHALTPPCHDCLFVSRSLIHSLNSCLAACRYVVDTSAFEANGCFLEIRPDEVLMAYGGSYSPKGNRFQLVKVDRERGAAWPIPITDGDRELGLAGLGPGGGPRADGRAPPVEVVRQTVTLTY